MYYNEESVRPADTQGVNFEEADRQKEENAKKIEES